MQTGTATLENRMEVPQKVKNRATLYLAIAVLAIYWKKKKKDKNTNSKGYLHPNIYSSIIYNSQIVETAQVSIKWWMDKEDVVQ